MIAHISFNEVIAYEAVYKGDTMRKKILILVLALFMISLFYVIKLNDGAETIEEALYSSNPERINIIHEEMTSEGIIVFYNHKDWGDFSAAFVKKNLGGYKALYSGTSGDIDLTLSKKGLSEMYFPAIEGTSLPIYFGLIGDPDICEVKVIEKKRNIEGQAKIIDAEDKRIWLMYMDQFEGSKFDIIGLSENGEEIIRLNGNIPYRVEEKTIKSPYK